MNTNTSVNNINNNINNNNNNNINNIINNKKLVYQIISKGNERIIINEEGIVDVKPNDIFRIYHTNNKYVCILNNRFIQEFDELRTIKYYNSNYYALSTILSLSLQNSDEHSRINFDHIQKLYLNMMNTTLPNMQLCICHTETTYDPFLDNIIESNNINYIFIKNPFHFNLGYCRNLCRYVCNSNKIMHTDIDIPLTAEQIIVMMKKSQIYDIVKPYHRRLIFTTKEEKEAYLLDKTIPERDTQYLGTITGGIVLFDKKVLIETGGYEEFNCYGLEDRCLDVVVLNRKYTLYKIANKLLHLYHDKPSVITLQNNYNQMLLYVKKYYNCLFYDKQYKHHVHEHCKHKKDMTEIISFNKRYNADLTLFNHPVIKSLVLKNRW
jgi:hypothetical protein